MFLQDVRYAVRALWNSKPFAAVGILCLGFGIGLNATIFSIIDGVLLKPYPYHDPDRILVVGEQHRRAGEEMSGLSYLDMRDWKEGTLAFTTIAASRASAMTVSDSGGEPERYLGAAVSWDLFPLLGTSPILGRGFSEDDDKPNTAGVVLLSHHVWITRYQADENVIGRRILLNPKPLPSSAWRDAAGLRVSGKPAALDSPGAGVHKDERRVRYLFASAA